MTLKLRRGTDAPRPRPPIDAPKPAATHEAAVPATDVPEFLERTELEILQWCGFARYKITGRLTDERIAEINDFRHRKGLPPYKLIAKPLPSPPQQPHPASHDTILRWANQRGLCMDGRLDLKVVNDKAVSLGLAPFELEHAPRRAVSSIIRHHQQHHGES